MPAMHDEVRDLMVSNLEEKCKLMLRLKPFSMTHEECLRLVAPRHHVDLLLEASKIAATTWYGREIKVTVPAHVDGSPLEPEITFTLTSHAYKDPPLVPSHPSWQADAPREVADRVVSWLLNRYEVGRKFGMAKHVLFELNRLCTHGSQLTYLMPTVSHLCVRGKSSRMDTWLDRFGAYKPVKNAPALSLPLLAVRKMPVGVQLVGLPGHDHALVCLGRWLMQALHPDCGREASREGAQHQ